MELSSEISSNYRPEHENSSPSQRRSTNRSPPRIFARVRSSSTVSPLIIVPPGSSGVTSKTAQLMTLPRQLATTVAYKDLQPVQTRLNRCDIGLGVLAVLCMVLAWTENEEGYRTAEHRIGLNVHALRSICMASAVLSGCLLYQRYSILLRLLKLSHTVDVDSKGYAASLMACELLRHKFLLELLLHAITPVPGEDWAITVTQLGGEAQYRLDDFLVCGTLLRTYLLFRLVAAGLVWKGAMSERLCRYHNCQASDSFVLRCCFRTHPYPCLCVLLLTITLLSGLILRVCERGFDQVSLHYLWNCIWLTIETMTTSKR